MKLAVLFISFIIILPLSSDAKTDKSSTSKKSGSKLTSDMLDSQGKELDDQILKLNKNISSLIKNYKLLTTKDIRILPYQTTYRLGNNYIEIERHLFKKDPLYRREVSGIRKKKMKIYTDGNRISKIESTIYEKDFNSDVVNEVFIVDPSPETAGTDDILFSHTFRGRVVLENKKLKEIKNTTANPVRNEIKQNFLIPHLTIFYNSLLFTASSYYKSLKDADSGMTDFLKKSTNY